MPDSFVGIQVGVSVFKILLHVTRPNSLIMGNIKGTQIYHSLSRYKEASRVPSFLILAIESPIYFANSTYLQERLVPSFFYILQKYIWYFRSSCNPKIIIDMECEPYLKVLSRLDCKVHAAGLSLAPSLPENTV